MKTRVLCLPFAGILAIACMLSDAAWADQAYATAASDNSDALGEIVVTAQKRAEGVQSVPLAVTAVTGDVLKQRDINDAGALAQMVPNVVFNSASEETRIGIRGITFDNIAATGGEARVGYFLDGIYISPSNNINGSLFDLDRIEVLRGPQGTLFGRNTVAGAVSTITKDPTDTYEGYLQENVGNYRTSITEGAVGGPITDGVSFRVAGRISDHDGYGKDLTTDQQEDNLHQRDVRAKLKIQPIDALKIVLSADYSLRNDNTGYFFGGYEFPGTSLPGNPLVSVPGNLRESYADTTTKQFLQFTGFAADVNWDLGEGLTFTSLSAYRKAHEFFTADFDYTIEALLSPSIEGDIYQDYSEEFRLQKDFSRGHIMGGLYYFGEWYESGAAPPINLSLFGGPDFLSKGIYFGGEQRTRALGVFSQGTVDFSDALHLTLGVRYSSDRKRAYNQFGVDLLSTPYDPATACRQPCNSSTIAGLPPGSVPPEVSRTWSNFSPRVTLQYDFDEMKNVYATYSKGFKSGGYNLGVAPFVVAYNPETLTDYEVGFKGDFLGRRLRTNIAAFYYDYKNLQVYQELAQAIGAEINNAAGARLFGLEGEIDAAPVEHFRIDLAFSLMKSYFTQFNTLDPSLPNGPNGNDPNTPFNLSGNRLPSSPKYTATYGAQYTWPTNIGGLTLRGEGSSISQLYFDQYNVKTVGSAGYTLANAFLNYESSNGRYYGSIYGRNLTNVFRIAGATVSNGFSNYAVQTAFIPPRTYGVTFGLRF